ncbi:MAG: S-adenosylmethionine tRNA ribosyltransferase [Bacteroidetes bacterium GWF2_40_14]|nr:MAG: S-adenosylmethionine tRNA ribosyltransferase [Bacteroidetes bacterium GWF2_40_14]
MYSFARKLIVEPEIRISDFSYNLPEEKIAKYPLHNRDDSKILIFKNRVISESKFSNLVELLPEDSLMIFNNSKVVPARLLFKKDSGANIEIFCLEPHFPVDYNTSFAATENCSWVCVVGNSKKWKNGYVLFNYNNDTDLANYHFKAKILKKTEDKFIIEFSWESGVPFSELMELCGKVPIPPYLKRDAESTDKERYQTLYARYRGSVAAPTAGLHFTNEVIKKIESKGIDKAELCLHVGAGTFLPVKSELIKDHNMHSEPFTVSDELLTKLLNHDKKRIIAVGTTSARCLESLYYLGIHCIESGYPSSVSQWEPYDRKYKFTLEESLTALRGWMKSNGKNTIDTRTMIIIVPGFKFRVVDILITNFHQPKSTLLLLISAFIGEDWRRIYDYSLANNFRFLSYGDSSILFR